MWISHVAVHFLIHRICTFSTRISSLRAATPKHRQSITRSVLQLTHIMTPTKYRWVQSFSPEPLTLLIWLLPQYRTSSKQRPRAGAVIPACFRSQAATTAENSSAVSFPRPTSTKVPTMLRTMYLRKPLASMVMA